MSEPEPESGKKPEQLSQVAKSSIPPEVLAIGGIVQPLAEALTKTAQVQSEAAIKTAQIQSAAEARKFEVEARASEHWNLGVLAIIAAIAVAGIVTLFTGQATIGEKLLFGVIGFFGGFGAATVSRKKR